jgi:hypothetical protein
MGYLEKKYFLELSHFLENTIVDYTTTFTILPAT